MIYSNESIIMKNRKEKSNGFSGNLTLLAAYKKLSKREGEVLEKIAEEKSIQQIADELCISKKTVETHFTNIGDRLNLKGRGRVREWIANQKLTP